MRCIVSSYENSFMHNTIGFFFQESALAKNFPIYVSVTPTIVNEPISDHKVRSRAYFFSRTQVVLEFRQRSLATENVTWVFVEP